MLDSFSSGRVKGRRENLTMEPVIKVEHVSKKFCRYLRRSMFYGMQDIGRNLLGFSAEPSKLRRGEFWAVDDVSFELCPGEMLGIIGANGSGKSTMLKMLNGIFMPDSGRIVIRGKVGALIAIGAGFHPMLTGRENVYINGAILGMSKKELQRKFDDIVEFADIGDFLDTPVKFYSSGMFVRLGFAVAIHAEPEILLVDEVLAVGDYKFQQKAFSRIENYKQQGMPTVLVSHNLHTIRFMCDKVIVLNRGKVQFIGDANQAVQTYQTLAGEEISIRDRFGLNKGSNLVKIKKVELLDLSGEKRNVFHSNEGIIISVEYFAETKIENPIIYFGILRDDGLPCYSGTTAMKDIKIEAIRGKGSFKVKIPKLYVNSGNYIVGVVVFNQSITAPYGADAMGDFVVVSDYPRTGKSCPAFSVDYEWSEITNGQKD